MKLLGISAMAAAFAVVTFTPNFLLARDASSGGIAPPDKPVVIMGESYGKYDLQSVSRNIFDFEDWVFESANSEIPVEDFAKYRLVFISHAVSRPYTAKEHEVIEDYIRKGGTVVLMHYAPKTMADESSKEAFQRWFGMELLPGNALKADLISFSKDSVLEGVAKEDGTYPSWVTEKSIVGRFSEGVESLIGEGERALVARRKLGEGTIYYLGPQVFRLRGANSPHLAESDSYLTLIRNIIEEAKPLRLKDWHKTIASSYENEKTRFLLWNREWDRGVEAGPVFIPPLPAKDELVKTLKVEMACHEQENLQLNLTDLGAGGKVTWKSDLGGLPPSALTVFVQERPDPIPWPKDPKIAKESPFWLMPPEAVEPKGEQAVNIAPGQTRIFWLKLDTRGLNPGKHQGNFEFFVDGKSAGKATLDLTIHPVRLPNRRLITLQPSGHTYGDVNRVEPALRFKRNLRDLGFEWTLINTLRPSTFKVKGAELNTNYINEHFAQIASDAPPAIDFSSMDGYVDASLDHNLTYFRVTDNVSASIDVLLKKAKLDDDQKRAVRHWYFQQFADYLKDKGIRNFYVSMGDELSLNELRDRYLPWCEEFASAGWTTTSSFTASALVDPELTDRLAKSVGSWTLNRGYIPEFMQWKKEGKIHLPDDALVGTYGAGEGRGTEIRKNASASRMIGWESWAHGTDYCAPNPYFKGWLYYCEYRGDRGISGERFVAYLDIKDLDAPMVNSPFVEGMRESLEDANLAAILSWYLEKLGDRVPASVREAAGRIVGDGPDAIIQWKGRATKKRETIMINSTLAEYERAKVEVLRLLGELRGIAKEAGIKPSVFWNNLPLVKDGEPLVSLSAPESEAKRLQKAIGDFPLAAEAGGRVVVGSELPADLQQGMARGYHSASRSWIRDWKDTRTGQTVIWIGGKDEAETRKAVERFCLFLRTEGDWLIGS